MSKSTLHTYTPQREPRMLYTAAALELPYGEEPEAWISQRGCADAHLVASLTEDHAHAPVLDLDFAARLSEDGTLWLDAPLHRVAFLRLTHRLASLGLALPATWSELSHKARLAQYQSTARVREFAGRDSVLERLASAFEGSIEMLLKSADAAVDVEYSAPPTMENPWPLRLTAPASLVRSTNPEHFHLYVHAQVEWEEYKPLLGKLAKAGVIEPGYRGASVARGKTQLRVPGIKKQGRDDVDPEAVAWEATAARKRRAKQPNAWSALPALDTPTTPPVPLPW